MANTILAALVSGGGGAVPGIARSTNYGVSWSQTYTYGSDVVGLCSTPAGIFAISYNGHLLCSTNDGVSWSDLGQIHATATSCADIGYIGNNTLVVANASGTNSAFISYNLGSSWSVLLTTPVIAYRVLDLGGGIALILGQSGTSGFEYKTTNYGSSWSSVSIDYFIVLDAAHFGSGVVLSSGCEYYYSGQNQVKRSTDYGETWSTVLNLGVGWWGDAVGILPGTSYGFATVSKMTGPSYFTRYLYRSSNSGETWPTNLGSLHLMTLDGGSGSILYAGELDGACPTAVLSYISVSSDYGGSFSNTLGYGPARFIEVSSATPPVADFEGSPTGGYAPLGVTFMDLSTNTPTSWAWDFGDGSPTGIDQNPYHLYTGAGSYTVSLTSSNPAGEDTETKTSYIVVESDTPSADFLMNKTSGYSPLGVYFYDNSTSISDLVSWYWTFGDGKTSNEQNPYHIYTSPGVYTVSLTVMNAVGRSDTKTKSRIIVVALAVRTLMTIDEAPPKTEELLSRMINVGDASNSIYPKGIRYYIPSNVSSPSKSGFRRPFGPSLIFD